MGITNKITVLVAVTIDLLNSTLLFSVDSLDRIG